MQIAVNTGLLVCGLFLAMSGLMMAWFVSPEAVGDMLGFICLDLHGLLILSLRTGIIFLCASI